MKITTIKLTDETKKRLLDLDFVTKDKSFDIAVNELISFYKESEDKRKKDYEGWKKEMSKYENDKKSYDKEIKEYNKKKDLWKNLLKWAQTQGFKG